MKLNKKNRFSSLSRIAVILVLAFSAITAGIPMLSAHTPPQSVQTYSFLNAAPNPTGVGQTIQLTFWLSIPPPTANGPYGDRWQDFTVKVTKPDGTSTTLGPFKSDPVGSSYTAYTPDVVGTYSFQMFYSGQVLAGANPGPGAVNAQYSNSPYINDSFLPSQSSVVSLTVQQQPVGVWQEPPLPSPNQYWRTPIDANNRGWYVLAGNWLAAGGSRGSYNASGDAYFGGGFNPYTTAPSSAHVLWRKSVAFGGIMGGTYGGGGTSAYYDGMNYELHMDPPVIMNGVLYYNKPNPPFYGFYAVDLYTGQTIWYSNGTQGETLGLNTFGSTPAYPMISCGQIYNYVSPNQFGGIPYLWYLGSPNYYMYDAVTGNWLLTLNNAMRGTPVYGDDGSLLVYILDGTHNWLALWNSSAVTGMYPYGTQANAAWLWRPPEGSTLDWRTGIQWNVTVPSYTAPATQSIARIGSGIILATTGSYYTVMSSEWEIAYDVATGHQLWAQNRTLPAGSTSFSLYGPIGNGVYTEFYDQQTAWSAFSTTTGQLVWGPTSAGYTNAFGVYNNGAFIAYGNLYAIGYDGMIHAYDIKNGKNLWNYYTGSSGYETAYGHNPFFSGPTIADGKVYASEGHTHLQPLFRGAQFVCVNATTGAEVWSVLGWMQSPVVADGILIADNSYDNEIYAFGKGLSATTISASPVTIGYKGATTIQGTVTDQSPGQTCLGIPAAGTPAISDDSMSAWMEYLYMQQPKPNNATGVMVHLTAFDPNNNTEDLGYVMSDAAGNYAIQWNPPVPGVYKVTATFDGSNSYYSSSAEIAVSVTNVPAASAAPGVTPTPPPTTVVSPTAPLTVAPTPSPVSPSVAPSPPAAPTSVALYAGIAAVVIIIVVVAAALVLRKRRR